MNLDELVSTFKGILLSPAESLSFESQREFQRILKLTPSPLLFKLRSLLEIMQNQISSKNYKTYSAIFKGLLDSQESLPGRISPDILEPVHEGYVSYGEIGAISSEKVEITTGTSIWALFLKRQIQEENRVDQRQMKSVVILGLGVRSCVVRVLKSGFWPIFHCKKEEKGKKIMIWVKKVLKKWFLDVLDEVFAAVRKIERLDKRKKKVMRKIFERIEKKWILGVRSWFRIWVLGSVLTLTRFCVSPVLPEKEISEIEIKLNETQGMIIERTDIILKSSLCKLAKIGERVNFQSFFQIRVSSVCLGLREKTINRKKKTGKMEAVEKFWRICELKCRKSIGRAFYKIKGFVKSIYKREKALKIVVKQVRFRILEILNAFSKNAYKKNLNSSNLYKKLNNLAMNSVRKHFLSILSFPEVLLKKGFEMFIHNCFKKKIEDVNHSWRGKLSKSENKWKAKTEIENSRFKSGDFFNRFCKDYTQKLLRFSFQEMKRC